MEIITDHSNRFGSARDQGERETCLVFAVTAAHEFVQGLSQSLCIEWLYYYAIKIGNASLGEGTAMTDVSSAVRQYGQPFEKVWSYVANPNYRSYNPPHNPRPLFCASGEFTDFGTDQALDLLERDYPFVISLSVDRAFRWPTIIENLAIVEHQSSQKTHLLHAVLVVGHGVYENRRFLKVRNSWGQNWGIDGYAWLSEEFLTRNAQAMLWLQKVD